MSISYLLLFLYRHGMGRKPRHSVFGDGGKFQVFRHLFRLQIHVQHMLILNACTNPNFRTVLTLCTPLYLSHTHSKRMDII